MTCLRTIGRHRCGAGTVRSHIIPQAIGRVMRTPGRERLGLWSMDRASSVQGMVFEHGLLCAACDGALGPLDRTLVQFVRAARQLARTPDAPHLDVPGFAPMGVQRAVLAVFWRATIARRSPFDDVTLGSHTDAVGRFLYTATVPPPAEMDVWAHLLVGRAYPLEGYVRYPVPIQVGNVSCWCLVVCGVAFLVRREPRPLPPQFDAYRLGALPVVRLQRVPYVDTSIRGHVDRLTSTAAGRRRRGEVLPFGSAAAA